MQRLSYIPDWRGDESLYSWASAYHVAHGNGSARQTGSLLFDAEHACKERDAPRNLHHLVKVTGGLLGDVRELIRQRTTVGQFIPFLTPQRLHLFDTQVSHQARLGWRILCGMPASSLEQLSSLRQCPQCVADDVNNWGLPRWRTSHQSIGQWICLEHQQPLITEHLRRTEWLLPCLSVSEAVAAEHLPDVEMESLMHLAKLSLQVRDSPWIDIGTLRQLALGQLREHGVTSWSYPVNRARLALWFRSTPLASWMSRRPGTLARLADGEWIHDLLRDRVVAHPLKWLLFWSVLEPATDPRSLARKFAEPAAEPHWDAYGQGQIWSTTIDRLPRNASQVLPSFQTLSASAEVLGTSVLGLRRSIAISGLAAKEVTYQARMAACSVAITTFVNQRPGCTREEVRQWLKGECEWLRKHEPVALAELLSRATFSIRGQMLLFDKVT